MKKILAIAILALICLSFLTPVAYALEKAAIIELETRLSTELEENTTPSDLNDIKNEAPEEVLIPTSDVPAEIEGATYSSDWDYSGEGAPENWGKLREEYKLCEVGEMQSPIDLDAVQFKTQTPLDLDYAVTTFEVVNNGHSIQVNYPKGSTATIGEETYELLQLHFHTPSEHTINGEHAAMEIHLVHTNGAGEMAIIGSMVEIGEASYEVNKIWQNIPALGESRRSDLALNPKGFIPKSLAHATYLGSLTTPPCSENVNWVVMAEPVTFSQEQIETFQRFYPMDARPIQRKKSWSY